MKLVLAIMINRDISQQSRIIDKEEHDIEIENSFVNPKINKLKT